MHKNKKSAALVFLSIILSGVVLSGIGYILYLKWLADGNDFLFATDYSGVALITAEIVALVFEIIFISVTVNDRKAFNHINEENAELQSKYKKVCIRLKNSEKDIDNLKAVQSVLLQEKSNEVECGKEQWEKALNKISEAADIASEEPDLVDEKSSDTEIRHSEIMGKNAIPDSDVIQENAIPDSEAVQENEINDSEATETVISKSETLDTSEAIVEAIFRSESDRENNKQGYQDQQEQQTGNEPEVAVDEQDRVIKDIEVIRRMLDEIDQCKKYPTTLLYVRLKGVTVDEYYADMKNLFRRRAVWTSPKENQLLLFFVKEKQKNIMDFVWQHIVYQKEVKAYDFFNVDEENTVSDLIKKEKVIIDLIK